MSDEARVRGSHSCVDCLYIYIYLANAKKLAQSCAVCHHFTLISVRYSYYSSTSQWRIRKSSASCKIDEGYLFIVLRSSTTQRSQTEKKLSISRMITLINLLICETKPWLHDCGNAGNNFQWNFKDNTDELLKIIYSRNREIFHGGTNSHRHQLVKSIYHQLAVQACDFRIIFTFPRLARNP